MKTHWRAPGELSIYCRRVPDWANLSTDLSEVTCRWCLRAIARAHCDRCELDRPGSHTCPDGTQVIDATAAPR